METPPTSTGAPELERRQSRSRKGLVALVAATPLLLASCKVPDFWVSRGETTQAHDTFKLWQLFMVLGIIVGVFVLMLMLWAIVRYRAKGDAIPKQTQYHVPLEIIYTVIPAIMVAGLFWATVVQENKVTAMPVSKPTVTVDAFQWGWKFRYPGHPGATVVGQTTENPTLVLPAGVPSKIVLTSSDVVHGFYVHDFNFSRYAQPGVVNTFTLTPKKTGTFDGQCTQLCGLYHSLMYFKVKVVTPAEFQQWLATSDRNAATGTSQGGTK